MSIAQYQGSSRKSVKSSYPESDRTHSPTNAAGGSADFPPY